MKMKQSIFLMIFFLLLFGCLAKVPHITLPNISEFSSLTVESRWGSLDGDISKFTITDRNKIAEIYSLIKGKGIDWEKTFNPGKPGAWRILVWLESKNEREKIWINNYEICFQKGSGIPRRCVKSPEKIKN